MFEMLYFIANKIFTSVLFVLLGRQSKTRDPCQKPYLCFHTVGRVENEKQKKKEKTRKGQ